MIRCLNDVKYSFNSYTMSCAAISCGAAALENTEYFKTNISKIVQTRENVKEQLRDLGFEMYRFKGKFFVCDSSEI